MRDLIAEIKELERKIATKESDIVHEDGNHWVLRTKDGYEVYRNEGTHSVRCGIIGYKGIKGLEKAKAECARREAKK